MPMAIMADYDEKTFRSASESDLVACDNLVRQIDQNLQMP
jgi:hypothetical protein